MVPLVSKVGVHVHKSPGKVPVIIFSTDLNKTSPVHNVTTIRPVVPRAETASHDEANSHLSQFFLMCL